MAENHPVRYAYDYRCITGVGKVEHAPTQDFSHGGAFGNLHIGIDVLLKKFQRKICAKTSLSTRNILQKILLHEAVSSVVLKEAFRFGVQYLNGS